MPILQSSADFATIANRFEDFWWLLNWWMFLNNQPVCTISTTSKLTFLVVRIKVEDTRELWMRHLWAATVLSIWPIKKVCETVIKNNKIQLLVIHKPVSIQHSGPVAGTNYFAVLSKIVKNGHFSTILSLFCQVIDLQNSDSHQVAILALLPRWVPTFWAMFWGYRVVGLKRATVLRISLYDP